MVGVFSASAANCSLKRITLMRCAQCNACQSPTPTVSWVPCTKCSLVPFSTSYFMQKEAAQGAAAALV